MTVVEVAYDWNIPATYAWDEKITKKAIAAPKKQQEAPQEIMLKTYQEFSPALLAVIITKLIHKVFGFVFLEALFVSSTAFFLTLIVRNLCKEYTHFAKCEEIALEIARKFPYIHAIVAVIAAVSIAYFPSVSIPLAVGVGILTALTYRVRLLSAVAVSSKDIETPAVKER